MAPFDGKVFAICFICALVTGELSSKTSSPTRTKRIIWGRPLLDYHSYDSVGYFAFITKGNIFSFLISGISTLFTGELPNPTPDSLRCGGTLITKNVVQSACHCFCWWKKVNESYYTAYTVNGWEHWAAVFVGFTSVNDMREDGLWSKKFILHEKCAKLAPGFEDGAESATHDYALVLLNKDAKFRFLHQKTAPAYSLQSLTTMYYNALKMEAVCLYIGFGKYYWKSPGVYGESSPVLQHGWRVIRSYWYCFWRIYLHFEYHYLRQFGMRYYDVATWICTQYFGTHRASPYSADSGSPVTCHNHYVGLISFKDVLYFNTFTSTDFFGAIVFSQFENAIDYRAKLLAKINDYVKLKEWPPDIPIHIAGRHDWGPYFNPDNPTTGIWIIRRFSETESPGSIPAITSSSLQGAQGRRNIALSVSLSIFHWFELIFIT